MFEVKNKTTGEVKTVYAVNEDYFLLDDNGEFKYQRIKDFVPVGAADPVITPATTPCVFAKVNRDVPDLNTLINGIISGKIEANIGDTISITLTNGKPVDLVVTDCDGSSVRFETRDCLGKYVPMTDIEQYLTEVWEQLPDILRNSIIPTERLHRKANGMEYTVTRKLFLPAASEIFAGDDVLGDDGLYSQMEWYKDVHNRVRAFEKGGYADWYWTGSPLGSNSTNWCSVANSGLADYNLASNTYVAAPVCFRVG